MNFDDIASREDVPVSLHSSRVIDRARVLETLVDNLHGMAYRCFNDGAWTMVFVSRGCQLLTGFQPTDFIEGSMSWETITEPMDRVRVRAVIDNAVKAGQRFAVQYRITTHSGEKKWVVERGVGVLDELGQTVIEGFIEDISDQRSTLEALQQAELRYRNIFEHASEGIFQTTSDGRYLAANPALARIYGYDSPDDLIRDLSDIQHQLYVDPERRQAFHQVMRTRGKVINFESQVYRKDRSCIWISENAHIVRGSKGEFICYEGTVQDISERKNYQQQLEAQAKHDLLTGLPNRSLLNDRIEQGIARAHRLSYFLVLVFIDLDNFKFINDSLGHAAGDELLKQVAVRLTSSLRESDTVARLGGDEFVLVINDHYSMATVVTLLERIIQEIGRPITINGSEFQVGGSLGVALYPSDAEGAETLLRRADVAMYAAKARGRNNFQFFTAELNRIADERLMLESAMRQALESGGFDVHFQPKVNADRRLVGFEALARWQHPELGAVAPDRFIPIAEEVGLIVPLTAFVLRRAFEAACEWRRAFGTDLRMAVNLSPRLFVNNNIVAQVAEALRAAYLSADCVELEITESVLLHDTQRVIAILREFKTLGVHLAMDDFGTGYSSLGYLRRFPLDIIKIDRSLTHDVENEDEVAMIARAAITVAKSLRKTVIAEGVENRAQFEFLRAEGCDEFQGYWFAKPLSRQQITRMLTMGARTLGEIDALTTGT
ncbi:MAG TPA: EAL domain-containing protein [Spongiibacteraceae bacterium]|nr:EAL domain-containing protein [Spongiibacteraceae bacterium]